MTNTDEDLTFPTEFENTYLKVLNISTRQMLGNFLNTEGSMISVKSDTDEFDFIISNDMAGLAELAGFTPVQIINMNLQSDPTMDLIQQCSTKNATVGEFWRYLIKLERKDIIESCGRYILEDCQKYTNLKSHDDESNDCERRTHESKGGQQSTINDSSPNNEYEIVTYDDILNRHNRTIYDAFLSYSAESQDDRAFVRQMIKVLEIGKGLKLFIPGRDDIPGSAENAVTAYIIEKRCRTCVVLLSDEFLRSEVCEFQLRFTQALSPAARRQRLIPVIRHENTKIPRILNFMTTCDFTKTDLPEWVWRRLHNAIVADKGKPQTTGTASFEDSLKVIPFPTQRRLRD